MKWLLIVMLSNGSAVSLDSYNSKESCESKVFPMRVEIRSNQLEEGSCLVKRAGWDSYGNQIVPESNLICNPNLDVRTNAICIPKG